MMNVSLPCSYLLRQLTTSTRGSKSKRDRDMMMTFGFLNENVSFHICSQEIPPLFLVRGGYDDTAVKRITTGSSWIAEPNSDYYIQMTERA